MTRIFSWLDRNLLGLLAGFLLVFIPLYPKWPLFDILPGYIVRVRLEDFFVAATFLVFVVQFVRKKVSLPPVLPVKTLIYYLVIGFISVLVAIFVVGSVPLLPEHIAKTFLHWLRRVEYFTLFFVFLVSIRSLRALKSYLLLLGLTLVAVIIYGFGQKYLYWPAFSTMNREFSKGWWLYLTEHARVLSTFGGHYDLAAYLVITLTLAWSFFFATGRLLLKLLLFALIASGFWLLILTASRSSFAGYLVGVSLAIGFWTFRKSLGWGISRWFLVIGASILVMLSFGDLSDRYAHIFRFQERLSSLKAVLLRPAANAPKNNAVFLENNPVAAVSDVPPTPNRPADVTGREIPLLIPQKTASGASILVEKPRTYSQNALLYDLSTAIRLDALWPRAIAGFLRDPIFGSGYATLTKESLAEFTDAESTDNDYLRSLGETGIMGFLTFFGTIAIMIIIAIKSLGGLKDNLLYGLTAGFIGLTVGLLVNALILDLFEASKVAYAYWGVAGLTMGSLYLVREKIKTDYQPLRLDFSLPELLTKIKKILLSDRFWVSLLAVLTILLRSYKLGSPVADWHSWRQADTSAVTRDFVSRQQINWLYPTFEDLSSIPSGIDNPKGLRFVEFPLYNAATVLVHDIAPEFSTESAGRVTTALFSALSTIFIFLICKRTLSRRIGYLSALVFALLPYSIYFGRTILPDPTMVALSLGAIWNSLEFGASKKWRFFLASLLLAIGALLVKPYAIFLLLPLGYLWLVDFGFDRRRLLQLGGLFLVSVIPLFLWRWWISHYPEGVPASAWLFNGDGIRFKGAFWFWLFADRIGRLILGYWGLVLLGFGLVRPLISKYRFFPLLFLGSSILYLFVFATGNVRHDYYQILLLPSLSIIVGLGLDFLLFHSNFSSKVLALVAFILALGFGWYFVRDYYNINHPEIVAAGRKLQIRADGHEKALVVAPYDGDTAFLYQTNRKGWPIVEGNIDTLIKKGADYYVSVRFDDLTMSLLSNSETKEDRLLREKTIPGYVPKKYTLWDYTDQYVIIQLVPDKELPGN